MIVKTAPANNDVVFRTDTVSSGPLTYPQGCQDTSARLEAEVLNTCNHVLKCRNGYLLLTGKPYFIII